MRRETLNVLRTAQYDAAAELAAGELPLPCPIIIGQSCIILEWTMPGVDVLSFVCAKAPIVFPTGWGDEVEVVAGFHESDA